MVETVGFSIPDAAEISEQDAQGPVKAVYEEIKLTLRVPYVDPFFRLLAARCPDYLVVAWRALRPNAQTLFFETESDRLRVAATDAASAVTASQPLASSDAQHKVLRTLQYAGPKLFLCVAALRVGTLGQEPRLQELGSAEKRQLALGVPAEMTNPEATEPREYSDDAKRSIGEMAGVLPFPVIPVEWQAFAGSAPALAQAAQTLQSFVAQPAAAAARRDLQRLAQQSATMLPFRLDISPHALRHSGLSEQALDMVRSILSTYYACLPVQLVVTAAIASQALGRESAQASAFPPVLIGDPGSRPSSD